MTKRDWNNFFRAEDFGAKTWDESKPLAPQLLGEILLPQTAVEIANAILREELKKAKRVYQDGKFWEETERSGSTSTALLIDEKEIK